MNQLKLECPLCGKMNLNVDNSVNSCGIKDNEGNIQFKTFFAFYCEDCDLVYNKHRIY